MNPFRKKSQTKAEKRRPLFIESLEDRVLFSAAPVAEAPEPPAEEPIIAQESQVQESTGDEIVTRSRATADLESNTDGVTSINIQFDYFYDLGINGGNDFFTNNQDAKDELERAAAVFEGWILDELDAIDPTTNVNNNWTTTFENPATGNEVALNNQVIPANTIIVYVGGRDLFGASLAEAGPGGYTASGTQAFIDLVAARGEVGSGTVTELADHAENPTDPDTGIPTGEETATEVAPWGGSIVFSNSETWNFSSNIADLDNNESDFYSVALHEIAHVLGVGTADSWNNLVTGTTFGGTESTALNGGTVSVTADGAHWVAGTNSFVAGTNIAQETAFDPDLTDGERKELTNLDLASLEDIGWNVVRNNTVPEITAIGDQTVSYAVPSTDIAVTVADGDGEAVTLSVVASNSGDKTAFILDQQYNFHGDPAGQFINFAGLNEKFFNGNGSDWFYIVPDGQIYQWGLGAGPDTLIASLNSSFYDDLSTLFDVAPVAANMSETAFILDQINGFHGDPAGQFINWSGQNEKFFNGNGSDWFYILPDGQIYKWGVGTGSDTLIATLDSSYHSDLSTLLSASQPATVVETAFLLDQINGFHGDPAGQFVNFSGQNEKFFNGNGSDWFYILPDGTVYEWGAGSGPDTLIATLDSSYHSDLSTLLDPAQPPLSGVTVSITNDGTTDGVTSGTLTIDPDNGFTGEFTVTITANDGTVNSTESFNVTVGNSPPDFEAITDVEMSYRETSRDVALVATDQDMGDTVTFSAVGQLDVSGLTAYHLDQQYNFHGDPAGQFINFNGLNEKFFNGNGSDWFYIIPDGQIYKWGAGLTSDTLVASVNTSFYLDLSLLFDVAEPSANAAETAYVLDQINGFHGDPDGQFNNFGGLNEKFFNGNGSDWFYIVPDGRIYSWGAGAAADVLIATVDASYHTDLSTLLDPATPDLTDVALTVLGSTLTVTPSNGFTGNLLVTVTATDGSASSEQSFKVSITNSAPVWTNIIDQTIDDTQTIVTLNADDDDTGDTVTYSATGQLDLTGKAAYLLDQQYDFHGDPNGQFVNFAGLNEKFFNGNGSEWFYILPSGAIYSWDGSSNDTLVATLDSSYHTNLSSLFDVAAVTTTAAESAYLLDQQHQFHGDSNGQFVNFAGLNEKFFNGDGSSWYYIVPDGRVYRWAASGSTDDDVLVATLDSSYHSDLSTLLDPAYPPLAGVTLSVSGNSLTINPDNGFLGSLTVTVTATDGTSSSDQTFEVTVEAP